MGHLHAPLQASSIQTLNKRPPPQAKAPAQQPNQPPEQPSGFWRKLVAFFCLYAILILTFYVAYLLHQLSRGQLSQRLEPAALQANGDRLQLEQLEQRLDTKLRLLERYVELLAGDLDETKAKLRAREKCDCQLSCTFNGTRFADKSSWQNQCDVCTCQAGSISCLPKKCPKANCDAPVQVAGLCCPVCMKKCNYNNTLIEHGQKFRPSESRNQSKECKCSDGLIKCESTQTSEAQTRNKVRRPNKVNARRFPER